MTEEYKYWRRNKIKAKRDEFEFVDYAGFDEYGLLLELEEGVEVVEMCRYQGLVEYTIAEIEPDPDEGDTLSVNVFEFFFDEITDEKELGLLMLKLT